MTATLESGSSTRRCAGANYETERQRRRSDAQGSIAPKPIELPSRQLLEVERFGVSNGAQEVRTGASGHYGLNATESAFHQYDGGPTPRELSKLGLNRCCAEPLLQLHLWHF